MDNRPTHPYFQRVQNNLPSNPIPPSYIQNRAPISYQAPLHVQMPQQRAGLSRVPQVPSYPISQAPKFSSNYRPIPQDSRYTGAFEPSANSKVIMNQKSPYSPQSYHDDHNNQLTRLLDTKYLLAHEIGSGSFAKVYYCIDSETGDRVAVKRIDKRKFDDSYLEFIDNEIVVLIELENEHIIKFLDLFNKDNYIYIVTELCELGDLEQFIKKHFSSTRLCLPEELVKVFAYQITIAFSFGINDRDIIHRDMKLSNVLISQDLKLKVADFGLAKASKGKEVDSVGTPMTMAPEVLNNQSYGPACDVWSVGCMIFEMLEGRPPFKPQERAGIEGLKLAISRRHLIFERASKEAQSLINKMLTINPSERITWIQIVNHPWFEECLQKGEQHLQKISSDYSGYVLFEHKHFDMQYAKEFGVALSTFASQLIDQFYVTSKRALNSLQQLRTNRILENNHVKIIDSVESLLQQVIIKIHSEQFDFTFKQRIYKLEIPKWNRKKISYENPDIDFANGSIDNRPIKQLIQAVGAGLFSLCDQIIEFNFEFFQTEFYPIVALLSLLTLNQGNHGFLTEIQLDKEKASKIDMNKIVLIYIPRAYSEYQLGDNGLMNMQQQSQIPFISKHVKFTSDKPQKEVEERLYFLYDIVIEHKNHQQSKIQQQQHQPPKNDNFNLPLHF